MSPETTHKLMGFYMEVLILGAIYFSTWFLLHSAVFYRVYRVNPPRNFNVYSIICYPTSSANLPWHAWQDTLLQRQVTHQ